MGKIRICVLLIHLWTTSSYALDRSNLRKSIKCQRDLIAHAKNTPVFSGINSLSPNVYAGKFVYSNLSRYDVRFLSSASLKEGLALKSTNLLSRDFVNLVCAHYKTDSSQSNAVLHFALSALLSDQIGQKRACEFTTGHELFPQKKEQGWVHHKYELLPSTGDNKMDLSNNAAGHSYQEHHPKVVKNCLTYLKKIRQIKIDVEAKSELAAYTQKGQVRYFSKRYPEELKREMKISPKLKEQKFSCWEMFVDSQKNSRYQLSWQNTKENSCMNALSSRAKFFKDNWDPGHTNAKDPRGVGQ